MVETEDGLAVLKTMLFEWEPILEYFVSRIAQILEVPVPDFAILEIPPGMKLRSEYNNGTEIPCGPTFAAKYMTGGTLKDVNGSMQMVVNTDAVAGFVLLDTLTLNADRSNPNDKNSINYSNVMVDRRTENKFLILAIDHGNCFGSDKFIPPTVCKKNGSG